MHFNNHARQSQPYAQAGLVGLSLRLALGKEDEKVIHRCRVHAEAIIFHLHVQTPITHRSAHLDVAARQSELQRVRQKILQNLSNAKLVSVQPNLSLGKQHLQVSLTMFDFRRKGLNCLFEDLLESDAGGRNTELPAGDSPDIHQLVKQSR